MLDLLKEPGPSSFREAVRESYAKAVTEAHPQEVDRVAARLIRNAGFYKTSSGKWEQLTPDLRDKVNIRKGIQQPDGKILVEDVDVFYPNAVKGDDPASQYTLDRVRDIRNNTNQTVNSGGQPPALVREHPSPERKARGIPSPADGYAFNFRESPRGKEWTRCHLMVSPDLFEEWKKGKWIGLSAGFACDKDGTNMRYGHIALLGADMQALSQLPKTEVFSADDQLCFAAVQCNAHPKGPSMAKTLTEDQKKAYMALATAHASMNSALQAFAAGDPEAEKKEQAALTQFEAAQVDATKCGLFAAEEGDGGEDSTDSTDSGDMDEKGASGLPSDTELDALMAEEPVSTTDVGATDGGEQQEFAAEIAELRSENATLKDAVKALLGRDMNRDFAAYLDEMKGKGHQFDAATVTEMFHAVIAQPEAIKKLKDLVAKSPIDPKHCGQTFSAEDAGKDIRKDAPEFSAPEARSDDEIKAQVAELNRRLPGHNFSAEDVKLGLAATSTTKK